jgi:adenosine deaminase
MGFSLNDLKQIVINGFKATFLSKKKKQEYINKVKRDWKKYFSDKK